MTKQVTGIQRYGISFSSYFVVPGTRRERLRRRVWQMLRATIGRLAGGA